MCCSVVKLQFDLKWVIFLLKRWIYKRNVRPHTARWVEDYTLCLLPGLSSMWFLALNFSRKALCDRKFSSDEEVMAAVHASFNTIRRRVHQHSESEVGWEDVTFHWEQRPIFWEGWCRNHWLWQQLMWGINKICVLLFL